MDICKDLIRETKSATRVEAEHKRNAGRVRCKYVHISICNKSNTEGPPSFSDNAVVLGFLSCSLRCPAPRGRGSSLFSRQGECLWTAAAHTERSRIRVQTGQGKNCQHFFMSYLSLHTSNFRCLTLRAQFIALPHPLNNNNNQSNVCVCCVRVCVQRIV